jgi:subtilisin family serine protease
MDRRAIASLILLTASAWVVAERALASPEDHSENPAFADDQTIVRREDQPVANPAPQIKSLAAQNARHKVLLAIVDSGTDYNHPLLAGNMHYQADDRDGLRLGYDYVGEDALPAPYIVRTSLYAKPRASDWARENARDELKVRRALVKLIPELETVLPPGHAWYQEAEIGAHGTHVGGLMVFGRPDFGLIPYRVLPHTRQDDPEYDYDVALTERLLKAVRQAAQDGAQILNLSIGGILERPSYSRFNRRIPGTREEKKAFDHDRRLAERFRRAVREFPQMLFVIAAGNQGKWVDQRVHYWRYCVSEPNALCVGAYDEAGNIAAMSNVVFAEGVNFVLAPGTQIHSTVPRGICDSYALIDLLETPLKELRDSKDPISSDARSQLNAECLGDLGMGHISGTSMAAPQVSRLAAEILADAGGNLSGAELAQAVLDRAEPMRIGSFSTLKLRVSRPKF